MSINTDAQGGRPPVAAPRQPPQHKSDDHWPICRCGHPTHPQKVEERHGRQLERFACPLRRWWNGWRHPFIWQPPRERS